MTIIGSIALVVFVVVFLVDGWTRPGYHPVRQPVSALALGRRGWIQTTNFIVCGAAVTVGAVGVAATFGSGLLGVAIGVFGVSLMISGLFPMDAMRGYPPGTPDRTPTEYTRRHKIHDHAGAVVFTSLPAAAIVAVLTVPGAGWSWFSGLTAVALTIGFVVFGQAWEDDSRFAGLVQRMVITAGWVWLALLFFHAGT
ncbi:DUF998 domain-containing protein [Rhodococcus artemisiae]|uniref:DUF998 domain-containing protein n=1 Tax=Rhodococcus artemisiae TaxID=714159 RepID=A0ABU7LFN5_9NOCA|nr:DUF998 domain-containing protein [Rhodococcus artemisiae]MEE2059742.1 DUF998 domain-containing protein [Rhodococcus artemisiae]